MKSLVNIKLGLKIHTLILPFALMALTGCAGSSSSSSDNFSATSIASNGLVINEIVAKDADGGDDWIELYVTSGSVNLSDYTIIDDSDDSEQQSLPSLTLNEGDYVVIKAIDEDDIDDQKDDLWVAVKLGSSDSVSLSKDETLVDYVEWDKGEALKGFSYGRFTDGIGSLQTLSPTAGAANIQADRGPLVINEIVNQAAGGADDWFELYNASTESIQLSDYTIVDDTDDLNSIALPSVTLAAGGFIVIYATETDLGEHYVPFTLEASDSLTLELDSVTVDYIEWDEADAPEAYSYGAFPDGDWQSQTLLTSKGSANIDVVAFNTTAVESVYITLEEADWQDIIENAEDKEDHTASITYKDITLDNIAFRTKGNSTLTSVANISEGNSGYSRFSFKVDTNEYVSGQKLLNLKKLNFNNNYNDPSYIRESISYSVMRNLGIAAPRTSFVNLYINGDLHGLYTMVEQVDKTFLENNFENPDGDLYKPDDADNEGLVGHDLVWIDAAFESYSAIELKTNEDTTESTALMTFLNEINNGDDFDSVLNADAMLRYLAASTVMSNLDSYQGTLSHNYYLYEENDQFLIIPWDFNESFGTFAMGCGDVTDLYIDEPTQGDISERPLIDVLLSDDTNLEIYHDYISALINGGDLDPAELSNVIDDYEVLITSSVENDPTAFYSHSNFESGLDSLLSFATDRAESVQDQLDGNADANGDGSGYCGSSTIGGPPGRP